MNMKLPRKIKKAYKALYNKKSLHPSTKWEMKAWKFTKGVLIIPIECTNNLKFDTQKWVEYCKTTHNFPLNR